MKACRTNPVWLLCGVALALRAGWIAYRWATHGAALDYPDEELHWQLATNLLHTGRLVTDDGRLAARMPLYPLFLAVFAALGPASILAARMAQAVSGAATVLVAYRLADAALGRRAAVVGGLLIGCDPFGIFFTNLLLSEVLFTFLALALLGCAWRLCAAADPPRRAAVGLALLGPAAVLTRPSCAALIPLVWLLVLGLAPQRRRLAPWLLLCPLALVLLVLPWGLRNKAVLGDYAWLSTNGGVTLYDAQGPQANGASDQTFLRTMPAFQDLGEVALDRTLKRQALDQMRADPARVLRLAGIKFLRTWSPVPNVSEYRGGAVAWAGAAYTLGVLLLAVIGLVRSLCDRARPELRRFQALLWLPVLYFTFLHCVYIGSVRYRVPLLPFLSLAAAAAAFAIRPITASKTPVLSS